MIELNDDDCPEKIREFVRTNPDIEVTQYIMRGANGEVYFGKRRKMGDDVVLKFYVGSANYDQTEEAVILRKIKHPNILEIFDLRFLPPYFAFFLTPKISGGDLRGILDDRKITSAKALEIVSQILLGLTELHSQHKLVHRDLKPGNILLDLPSNRPIIADLGAVKKVDTANGIVTASKATYLYLPPESILKNEYNFQSDIYQVGLILYQVLGGYFPENSPYNWLTDRERRKLESIKNGMAHQQEFDKLIGDKITKGKIADLKKLPFYLDNSFKRVLQRALHLDPNRRYENPSLFLRDVHYLVRSCPSYEELDDRLVITHTNGKTCQIYRNAKNQVVLEKRIANGNWQKVNSAGGDMQKALATARLK